MANLLRVDVTRLLIDQHKIMMDNEIKHISKQQDSFEKFRQEDIINQYHRNMMEFEDKNGRYLASDIIASYNSANVEIHRATIVGQLEKYQSTALHEYDHLDIKYPWQTVEEDIIKHCSGLLSSGQTTHFQCDFQGYLEVVFRNPLETLSEEGKVMNELKGWILSRHPFSKMISIVQVAAYWIFTECQRDSIPPSTMKDLIQISCVLFASMWKYRLVYFSTPDGQSMIVNIIQHCLLQSLPAIGLLYQPKILPMSIDCSIQSPKHLNILCGIMRPYDITLPLPIGQTNLLEESPFIVVATKFESLLFTARTPIQITNLLCTVIKDINDVCRVIETSLGGGAQTHSSVLSDDILIPIIRLVVSLLIRLPASNGLTASLHSKEKLAVVMGQVRMSRDLLQESLLTSKLGCAILLFEEAFSTVF